VQIMVRLFFIEQFPKSRTRFSDKKRGEKQKIETQKRDSKIVHFALNNILILGLFWNAGLALAQQSDNFTQTQTIGETAAESAPAASVAIVQSGDFDAAYHAYFIGNQKTAFDLAKPRADLGDAAAMSLLGVIYNEGRAVMRDPEQAASWFAQAAEAGDPQAALKYGLNLYNGFRVAMDKQRGEQFVRRAVEAGVPASFGHYAHMMMAHVDEAEKLDVGLEWFLQGAALGDADSAYYAAHILDSGTPTRPSNLPAARALLELAAAGGNSGAQMDLANWLIEGYGGKRDPQQAFTLIKILAVKQIVPAQLRLARMYYDGIGTSADVVMAASWYMLASQYDLKTAGIDTSDLDMMLAGMSAAQKAQAQARVATLRYDP